MSVLTDILSYLWRLIPANPILRRVVAGGGRRKRDMFIRCGYLGALIIIVILQLFQAAGSLHSADLAALTKRSGQIFLWMSYAQLLLVTLLAPIFTAGAITQEKDSQTYDILLSTPLTNGQIVLGSLLSRLFFVVALLISGIPIFSVTQIFGGVAIASIVQSFMIAAATAFVCGALAMAISVFKVGTRRTIFTFYLCVVLYMAIPIVIDAMGYARVDGADKGTHSSWFAGINPFLAQRVVFNDGKFVPPEMGQAHIADYPRWVQWYLSSPHSFYTSVMFGLSFVLVLPSIVLLRRLAQSSSTLRSWVLQKLRLSTGDKTRRVRRVWSNPIAWREAKTKASAARAVILRYAFAIAGIVGALYLVSQYAQREKAAMIIGTDGFDPATGRLTLIVNGELRNFELRSSGVTQDPYSSSRGNRRRTPDYDTPVASASTNQDTTIKFRPDPRDESNEAAGATEMLIPGRVVLALEPAKSPDGSPLPDGARLTSITLSGPVTRLPAETARRFLLGAVLIEFAVILLIVTQAAASTVTREKEDGTLDLLLSTPITSRYYIWGKLRGLVSFVLPLLAVPILSLVLFIVHDLFRLWKDPPGAFGWIVMPESLLILPGVFIIVCAFAAIVGMQMSLRCKKTIMAVMISVGIVMAAVIGLGACGYSALSNNQLGQGGLIPGAFSPFTLAWILIDPQGIAKEIFGPGRDSGGARILTAIAGWIITGVYAAIVWGMYKGMVRNFDMTVRKQAA